MDSPIEVRAGGPEDVAGALVAWAAAIEARGGRPVAPERRERTGRSLANPDSFLVVATTPPDGEVVATAPPGDEMVATAPPGDEMVGMALGTQTREADGTGRPIPEHCHISAVFVRPEWWGGGIGGRLVDAVLAEAAARGYRAAQLWTQTDNERALRLYASRGFVRSGRAKMQDGELIVHLTRDRVGTGRDPGPR